MAYTDAPALQAVLSDPAVFRYMPTPPLSGLPATSDFINLCRQHAALGNVHSFAIVPDGTSDTLVGLVQASRLSADIELGCALASARWGDRLMTDALTIMLRWAASKVGNATVWAIFDSDHTAAQRVLDHLGLIADRMLPAYRVHPAFGPTPRDCVRYAGRLGSLKLDG